MDTRIEQVNKVKHYNTHPSGVEAIEVCRGMSFNMGNAMKYLFRLKDKDGPLLNAQKALWYVVDEHKTMHPTACLNHPEGRVILKAIMRKVLDAEPDATIKACMRYVFLADSTNDAYFYEQARTYLSALIVKCHTPKAKP